MVTIGLSCTVSEIDGDFSRKSQKFSHPRVFYAPLKGFPLELDIDARDRKTRMMGLPD